MKKKGKVGIEGRGSTSRGQEGRYLGSCHAVGSAWHTIEALHVISH